MSHGRLSGSLPNTWKTLRTLLLGADPMHKIEREYKAADNSLYFGGEDPLAAPSTLLKANLINFYHRNISERVLRKRTPLQATANDTTEKAAEQAAYCTAILDFFSRPNGVLTVAERAVVNDAVLYGIGYVRAFWNPYGGRTIDGKPEGGIGVEAIHPASVYIDNIDARSMADISEIAHVKRVSRALAEMYFGEKGESAESMRSDSGIERHIEDPRASNDSGTPRENGVQVTEYFKRCMTKSGQNGWHRMVLVGDTPVPLERGSKKIYEFTPYLPYVRFVCLNSEASFFGHTPLYEIAEINIAFNRTLNQADFIARTSAHRILINQGDIVPNLTNFSGSIIQVGDTSSIKDWNPPPMPSVFTEHLAQLQGMADMMAGVSEVSSGGMPQGARSGFALQLAQTAEQSQADPILANMEAGRVELAQLILRILRDNASEEALRALVSVEAQDHYDDFKEIDLDYGFNVGLRIENGLPRDPMSKMQVLQEWVQIGVLKMDNDDHRNFFMRQLDMPESKNMNTGHARQIRNAQRIIEAIKKIPSPEAAVLAQAVDRGDMEIPLQHESGRPGYYTELLIPQEEQNDGVFIEQFESFLSAPDTAALPQGVRELMRARLRRTKQAMQLKAQGLPAAGPPPPVDAGMGPTPQIPEDQQFPAGQQLN